MYITISDFPAKGSVLSAEQVVSLACQSEQVGIDRFAISDFPFHLDCVVLMTSCLRATHRLGVESLVTSPFYRLPDVTACTWATMSELSGGRAILGVGRGGIPVWSPPWGFERPDGVKAVADLIDVCRAMWSGEPPPVTGRVLGSSGRRLEFALAERVPILVAARGPRMLRLAGEKADIVHIATPFLGEAYMRRRVEWVRAAADAAGRTGAFEIDITVPISVLDDGVAARQLAKTTAAAAMVWMAEGDLQGEDGQEAIVPAALVTELREGWRLLEGQPLPEDAADAIDDDLLARFVVAGTPEECAAGVVAAAQRVPGVTGVRLKLPSLTGAEAYHRYVEMIEHAGALCEAVRSSQSGSPASTPDGLDSVGRRP